VYFWKTPSNPTPAAVKQASVNDLDFLSALLHGRRSRLAEGRRLDGLCQLPSLLEAWGNIYPDTEFRSTEDFQARLVQGLVKELLVCLRHVEDAGADLLAWMLARFQIENVKVLVRGLVNHVPFEEVRRFIVPLPHDLTLDAEGLRKASSLEDFIARLPPGMPRHWLRAAATVYREQPRTFYLEAALDCGYFQELLTRTQRLRDEDKEQVKPLIFQEVDTFHLMLVLRGKFHYRLTPEQLGPLHITGSEISTERFAAMSADPDPLTTASRTLGRVLDELPSPAGTPSASETLNLAAFEALAWKRFLRFANLAFRRSDMGLGAVVGYLGTRRVEVANLITVSEAVGGGLPAEALS